MAVCQFFLQGRCRYGRNCRFEHSYNNEDPNNRNPGNTQQLTNVIKQIVGEVILAEKGGQWPLSVFSPVKEGPNILGFEDVSPEEVRWKMYEARANGTLNQCINEINQLYSNAEKMRNILKQPTMERVNLIVNALKGKKEAPNSANPFASNIFGSGNKNNIFGSTGQISGSHGSIFGSSPQTSGPQGSIFGGSNGNQGNIFGGSSENQGNTFGSSNFPNQNIFGSPSSSSFNQNTLQSPQTPNQNFFSNSMVNESVFSNKSTPSQNVFSNLQTGVEECNRSLGANAFSSTSGIFSNQGPSSQNSFFQSTNNATASQTNMFGDPKGNFMENSNSLGNTINSFNSQPPKANIFGGQPQTTLVTQFKPNPLDSSVYSKMEDLSKEEITFFTASTFTFGKIPLKPPPQEYCK